MKYSTPHRCAEPLKRSVTPNRPLSGVPVGYASQFIVFTAIHLVSIDTKTAKLATKFGKLVGLCLTLHFDFNIRTWRVI